MKIIRIDVHRVQVPMSTAPVDPTAAFKYGYVPTEDLHKHIIELYTDDGFVGLGETWKGTPDKAARAAAEFLLGKNPTRLSLQYLELPHDSTAVNARDLGAMVAVRPVDHNPSIHAFEVALADLVGQAHGVPIHQLLGGAVRDRVLVHYWSGRLSPEALAQATRVDALLGELLG